MNEPIDLEALAEDVAAAAAARRARGDYPPGLEAELDEHYRIVSGRDGASAVDAVTAVGAFVGRPPLGVPTEIDTSSSFPGGSRVHRLVGATVIRHQAALVAELNNVVAHLNTALSALAAALEPQAKLEAEIAGRLDAIEARLIELQRKLNDG